MIIEKAHTAMLVWTICYMMGSQSQTGNAIVAKITHTQITFGSIIFHEEKGKRGDKFQIS